MERVAFDVDGDVADATDNPGGLAALRTRLQAFGPARLLAMGTIVLVALAFLATLAIRSGTPDYGLLFTDLEARDAQTVVERLQALEVPYRLTRDGTSVMIPDNEILRVRMQLAKEGLPASGTVGYEIFDQQSALGTSQFEANVNLLRALEGELARTISTMDAVRAARVHIVMPKRELFRRTTEPPSASVVITLGRAGTLGAEQIAAIQHLVAGAVPRLEADQVTIVDDRGQLLAQVDDGDGLTGARTAGLKRGQEQELESTIRRLLERSIGPGKVDVSVSAEMDFDQVTTTTEEYDPDSQVARSTQTVEEETELVERDQNDAVTVQNNVPALAPEGDGALPGSNERTTRTEETVNFEISRTVRNHVQASGRIRRLSIAVLVDGTYIPGGDGSLTYEPRSQDELGAIEALVRGAAGFNADRGDVIEVVNRPFVNLEPEPAPAPGLVETAASWWQHFSEPVLLLGVTLALILFVFRPLLKRAFPADRQPALTTESGLTVTEDGDVLIEPGSPAEAAAIDDAAEELLQIDQVQGQIRASLVARVTSMIDDRPDEAVRVLRTWLARADG